ncbi:class D sortase [Bacillus sp. DNRA2]|nr:class D sortase [Bacillus sp. DNRA2]
MELLGAIMMIFSLYYLSVFGYQYYSRENAQIQSLEAAEKKLEIENLSVPKIDARNDKIMNFSAVYNEPLGTVEIPKLNRKLPLIEGTDANVLDQGVGHFTGTVFPGQNEQILISGHRDTVFRNFDRLEIGDQFIINMPYGSYTYEIRSTVIVHADDTTVIRKMGEEVLVVSTCYPFNYIGDAPDRFVIYAYPVKNEQE